ncbi:centrosomal protein of 162 kDa-like [Tubulanus polymorphus]|uniref:centrosomal protein of 162 kDa-like n=1 Tax=Tubulanus polymorphus TaxID=672921 RepID=UPI003DA5BDBF
MAKKSKQKKNALDEEFEAFLKESYSTDDSIDSTNVNKYLNKNKQSTDSTAPWWLNTGDDPDNNFEPGTGKSFLKKRPEPKPRTEPKPKTTTADSANTSTERKYGAESIDTMSRDSLDGGNFVYARHATVGTEEGGRVTIAVPGLSLDDSSTYTENPVLQQTDQFDTCTLDEEDEKQKFFKDLENNAESTIDFSRLNRDLDRSDTMKLLHTSSNEQALDDLRSTGAGQKPETSDLPPQNQEKPSMLSKVALLDSLDTTLGTAKLGGNKVSNENVGDEERLQPKTIQFSATVKSGGGTGVLYTDTSMELDALHKAYQEIGMSTIGTENGFQSHKNSLLLPSTDGKSVEIPGIGDSIPDDGTRNKTDSVASFGLKQVLPTDSNLGKKERTVSDIIKEVDELQKKSRIDLDGRSDAEHRGYHLSPAVAEDDDARGFQLSPAREDQQIISNWFNREIAKDDAAIIENQEIFAEDTEKPVPPKKTPRKSKMAKTPEKAKKTSKTKFSTIQSSGYGQQKKSKEKWSPVDIAKQKVQGTEKPSPKKRKTGVKSSADGAAAISEKQLMASVESFTSYIQQHFGVTQTVSGKSKKSLPEVKYSVDEPSLSASLRVDKTSGLEREKSLILEVKEWQEQWKQERQMHAKCKADMFNAERELKRQLEILKIEHEQQIFKLKQENFILAAKVTDDDGGRAELPDKTTNDESRPEKLILFEKEIAEQEKLLAGYQQENERLYSEMKRIQVMNKVTEERMFKENQRLQTELMTLRAQLERKEIELKNKGVITSPSTQQQLAAGGGTAVLGAGKIAQLEAEIKQAKKKEDTLRHEMKVQEQAKKELEFHIEKIVREKEELGEEVQFTKLSANNEIREIKKETETEVERLNRKLKWFAENQELLDRDTNIIREKNNEIRSLKDQLDSLKSQSGEKRLETQSRTKEKAADTKRIQDLERQVKEMETIMKRRNPNSIQALVWAAASADGPHVKAPSVEYLENRVKQLEKELDEKSDDGKRSLRVLEQKYTSMKFQYDERINELEEQLSRFTTTRSSSGDSRPFTHTTALQKELDTVRERSRKKLAEKDSIIERLNKDLSMAKNKATANMKNELQTLKDNETELQLKIKELGCELSRKDREVLAVQTSLERIRREKQQIIIDTNLHQNRHGRDDYPAAISGRKSPRRESRESTPSRQYEPELFKGLHISDVIREKEDLQLKIDRLTLEIEQCKHDLQINAETKQREIKNLQQHMQEQMNEMKRFHENEIIRVKTTNAVEHSASKVAELQSKVDAQQIMLTHLREKFNNAQTAVEQLPVLKIKETTLENQIKTLLDDLKEAKRSHKPEMRHFDSLLDKIRDLERKHESRESELKQIIFKNKQIATDDMAKEVAKWRQVIDVKNREIERFRSELDAILDVLEELRKQGVVIPSKTVSSIS